MAAVTLRLSRNVASLGPIIVAICLVLLSCSRKTGPATAPEIRIGLIVTTGEEHMRISTWNVVEMLRTGIEDKGGLKIAGRMCPLKLVIREIDGGVPEQAVHAISELINQEGVVAIVGPQFSIDALPAGEVAEKAGIPLISPTSTHPQTTAGRKYVFRTALVDNFQARAMARFSILDLGAERIAVFYNVANPHSRGLAEVFRDTVNQEGGRIIAFEPYVTGQEDLTVQLERIRASEAEVLYLPNFNKETEAIVVQGRNMGIETVLLGTDSWNIEKFSGMSEFDGSYVAQYLSPDMLPEEAKVFFDEYITRYGLTPENGTALTYDAIGILLAAIQHAGSFEPADIRDGLYDLGPYVGVSGTTDFLDTGDPERNLVIVHFENGDMRFHKEILPKSRQ